MIKTRISQDVSCYSCQFEQLCISKDLATSDLALLEQLITHVKVVSKKEAIYHMNDPISYIYAIYEGSCKEYWIDEQGNECITNFYFPGDMIGIESVSHQKYSYYTSALEEMRLCVIPINEFLEIMSKAPTLLKRFLTITNQKMRHDQSTRVGNTAAEKVADFLLNILMRMYERHYDIKEISLPMSQADIASYLGIAPETINRVFNMLKRKKIIKLNYKKFEILDIAELQRIGKLDYSMIN